MKERLDRVMHLFIACSHAMQACMSHSTQFHANMPGMDGRDEAVSVPVLNNDAPPAAANAIASTPLLPPERRRHRRRSPAGGPANGPVLDSKPAGAAADACADYRYCLAVSYYM